MNAKNKVDVIEGDIDSSLRKLALPLALGFVLNIVNGWVDKIYVSRLGDLEIGAMGISDQMRLLVFTLGIGFALGTGVVIARRIGEGNQKEADKTATQALIIMFLYGLLVSVVFYFSISPILSLLGYEGNLKNLAEDYLNASVIGISFNYLIFQINAIVRSTGNTLFAMTIITITIVINIILTPLMVYDYGIFEPMGMYGAGLSTSISQIIGFGLSFYLVKRGITPINLSLKGFKFDWEIIKKIFSRGIPSTLQYLSLSMNRLLMFSLANIFGGSVVTAYTLGLSFDLFVFMPIFGCGVAIEIISGQNMGAKKIDRIFLYFYSALRQIGFIVVPLMLFAIFGGKYFAMMFTNSPEIIDETSLYLEITGFSYLFFAVGVFCTRIISGAGDTWGSFIIYSSVLILIQYPLSYILSVYLDLGNIGIYLGILISYFSFLLIGLYFLYKKSWVKIKL